MCHILASMNNGIIIAAEAKGRAVLITFPGLSLATLGIIAQTFALGLVPQFVKNIFVALNHYRRTRQATRLA